MSDDRPALEPDELDELLSAELDGELDGAARERGSSIDEVMALIRATPGAEERRRSLIAARDLLTDVPEIDELLAARLRAKATRAAEAASADRAGAQKRRRQRMFLYAAGVAAATAAVVGIAAGLNSQPSSSKASSADFAAPPESTTVARGGSSTHARPSSRSGVPITLGEFTNAHDLAAAAVLQSAATQSLEGNAAFGTAQPGSSGRSASTTLPGNRSAGLANGAPPVAAADSKAAAKVPGPTDTDSLLKRAVTTCAGPPVPTTAGNTPVLRTTATLSGRPVIVLVFSGSGEHVVAIEDAACKLLSVQMLG